MPRVSSSRRDFIRLAATSSMALSTGLGARAVQAETLAPRFHQKAVSPNDTLRLATIGVGIIGFIDTNTALQVPGTELVAVADCYTSRLERAKEVYGSHLATTQDYREILAREDIDAVLICTPDHWHARMCKDAMAAGKHVYCEKPMVQQVEEGLGVVEAQRASGCMMQVGSQFASSIIYHKAKEVLEAGTIGTLNMVEARMNRNSAIGAWQYSIPPDASPDTIDWDAFVGHAPARPFDAVRFFRWRNYWDYGTGVAGDLFVHLLTGIHLVTGAQGPQSVMTQGGLRYWKDGRDVPDVMMSLMDYPETAAHAPFTLSLQVNFASGDGGGFSFRFIGDEGVMTISNNSLEVARNPRQAPSEEAVVRGYNSVRTFSTPTQEAFVESFRAHERPLQSVAMGEAKTYRAPDGYDSRLDHFANFFTSIREGTPVLEDPAFGLRAAAPSILSNRSYVDQKIYRWDADAMAIVM